MQTAWQRDQEKKQRESSYNYCHLRVTVCLHKAVPSEEQHKKLIADEIDFTDIPQSIQ